VLDLLLLAKGTRVTGREPASAPAEHDPQGASLRVLAEKAIIAGFPIVVVGVVAARGDSCRSTPHAIGSLTVQSSLPIHPLLP
jgi:hypothetical protein